MDRLFFCLEVWKGRRTGWRIVAVSVLGNSVPSLVGGQWGFPAHSPCAAQGLLCALKHGWRVCCVRPAALSAAARLGAAPLPTEEVVPS